jgi:predicted kinase
MRAALAALRRRPQNTRQLWSGALTMFYTGTRPVMIFTAGAPGAGKTYTLNRLFGLENLEMLDAVDMLDLDSAMKRHPEYDDERPAELYGKVDAYNWANARVERKFQETLSKPRKEDGRGRFVCFDGTGTRVKRQMRRMREAREAGFDIVQLYVEVSLETALRRNQQRDRTVPEEVLKEYLDRLDSAVEATVQHPDGLVDTAIAMNNDLDDDLSAEVRFGRHTDWIHRTSLKHEALFGRGWRHTFAGPEDPPPPEAEEEECFRGRT